MPAAPSGVITVSRYGVTRPKELYGVDKVVVVPELIDLHGSRLLFVLRHLAQWKIVRN